ncbi:hypothetical protein QQS21_005622 [Conoideocrella luteorostrata]|uniref:Pre-mRNA-splicing factor 38B n=1 Tax=Conoideocrella luteorostrata TaxID=1105319 RepID=A0AAJ0CQ78_9HYPO|nr:hypothetical protein QQS21_005622 [Conoideocrella luteorostrata]
MSNDELLTDDYVAGLLAQDAKDCSLKYSAMGMEAFRDNKKPSNIPKPNTRFLRHIIKGTDTHNKALLAKEAAESKARLKDLEYAEEVKRRKTNPNVRDIRKRQMGDIQAILGGKRKQRDVSTERVRDKSRRRDGSDTDDRRAKRSSKRDGDLIDGECHRRRHGRLSERDYSDGAESGGDRRRRSRRTREHNSPDDNNYSSGRRLARRDRSRSPRRRRSCSPDESRRRHRHRSSRRDQPRKDSQRRNEEPTPPRDEDSDPLEDFIGPPPPPKCRGRGTIGGAVALDRRFSESYDPSLDVQMAGEEDAWDDAVELFRDRQKMQARQDQRMKAAGFTDAQIQQSERSDEKKSEQDVVWSKAGERREWDEGKCAGVASDEDEGYKFVKQPTLFSEEY